MHVAHFALLFLIGITSATEHCTCCEEKQVWTRASRTPPVLSVREGSIECNSDAERAALVALYEGTGGPEWFVNTAWNSTLHHCLWYQVVCTQGCVTSLLLHDNNLHGKLPNVSVLFNMITLRLDDNALEGELDVFSELLQLEYLDVSTNRFEGPVPFLHNHTNLKRIDMRNNNLGGEFELNLMPADIDAILIAGNDFAGHFPNFDSFPNLLEIDIGYNQFSGQLPRSFFEASDVEIILASNNQFTGHMMPVVCPLLQHLDLSYNKLNGSIPRNFFSAPQLRNLDVSHNQLTGTLPDIPNQNLLTSINLNNQMPPGLAGTVPVSYMFLRNINFLNLRGNSLNGTLAPLNGNLQQLSSLDLGGNQFSGELIEFQNIFNSGSQMRILNLRGNKLTGAPRTFLCSPTRMYAIDLGNNDLDGQIPVCFGTMEYLGSVRLDGNENMIGDFEDDGTFVVPRFLKENPENRFVDDNATFTCPTYVISTASQPEIALDPSYYNRTLCVCQPDFVGVNGSCTLCYPGCVCPGGDAFSTLDATWLTPGPWAAHNTVNLQCRSQSLLKNPCMSTVYTYSSRYDPYGVPGNPCIDGHVGRLCAACAPQYYARGQTCHECEAHFDWLIPLLYSIGIVFLLWYVLHTSSEWMSSSVLYIVVSNLQSTSLLKNVAYIAWHPLLLMYFDVLAPSNFQIVAGDCLLTNENSTDETSLNNAEFVRLFKALFMPMAFVSVALLVFGMGACCNRVAPSPDGKKGSNRKYLVRILYILLFFVNLNYMNLTAQAFRMLLCEEDIGTGTFYMVQNPAVACDTEEHQRVIAIASVAIVMYVVAVPVLFFSVSHYNRHQLQMPEVYSALGFMYCSYKPNYYWWETVIFARKAALMAAYFLVPYESFYGPVAVFLVVQAAIVLQVVCNPYNTNLQNFLEVVSLYCLEATYIAGVLVQVPWVATTGGDQLSYVILVFNLLTLLYFIHALLSTNERYTSHISELKHQAEDLYQQAKTSYYKQRMRRQLEARRSAISNGAPLEELSASYASLEPTPQSPLMKNWKH